MNYVKGFVWMCAGVMMLMVSLLAGNLYFTLDARQTKLEATVSTGFTALQSSLTNTTNDKFEELRGDVNTQLHPISVAATNTLNASTALLKDSDSQVKALDIKAVNTTVASVNTAVGQVNKALPDFLDCQESDDGVGNRSCISERWNDLSSSADRTLSAIALAAPRITTHVEKISGAVADAAPRVAKSAEAIVGDAHSITSDTAKVVKTYTTPPTRAQKVVGFGKAVLFLVIKALV